MGTAVMVGGKEKNFSISPDDLKAIADQMEALPHVRDAAITTKAKAVAALTPAVRTMRDKGYSIDQIAAWISHNTKLKVTPSTLRDAVKPRRRQVKPPVRQTRKQTEEAYPTAPAVELIAPADPALPPGSFALGSDDV